MTASGESRSQQRQRRAPVPSPTQNRAVLTSAVGDGLGCAIESRRSQVHSCCSLATLSVATPGLSARVEGRCGDCTADAPTDCGNRSRCWLQDGLVEG